jgi:hypothetical protein
VSAQLRKCFAKIHHSFSIQLQSGDRGSAFGGLAEDFQEVVAPIKVIFGNPATRHDETFPTCGKQFDESHSFQGSSRT